MQINPTTLAAVGRLALVHESHLGDLIAAVAMSRVDPSADTTMRGDASDGPWAGYKIENGAAIIPVRGALITEGAFVGSRWGVTSYEGFRAEMRRAAADPKVDRIVMAVNSPGGSVAGIDGAAAAINEAKAKKPVTAMVEGMAASAAYWLASQADEIIMTPLSVVGSIGVVAMHADVSGWLEKAGITVSLIHAGRNKVDGNQFEPLSDTARADIQADVDALRLEFARAVENGRGAKFPSDSAMSTEAKCFPAAEAIKNGMADRIGSIDDAIANKSSRAQFGRPTALKGKFMSEQQGAPGAITITQADVDAARTAGHAAGASAERTRISAILGHASAKGREAQAQHMAFKTGMSPEDAAAILEAAPVAAAAAPVSALAVAMSGQRQANLGPGGERNPAADAPKTIDTGDIYARRAARK